MPLSINAHKISLLHGSETVPVSLTSGVFPPSTDRAGDGGELDLAKLLLADAPAAATAAEADDDDAADDADASRLLCALHAVYDGGGGGGGGGCGATLGSDVR